MFVYQLNIYIVTFHNSDYGFVNKMMQRDDTNIYMNF